LLLHKRLSKPVDPLADGRVRQCDRKRERAECRQTGLGVCAGVVRGMAHGIGEEGAGPDDRRRRPAIREVLREPREREPQKRCDGQQPGLGRDQEMGERDIEQVPLNHQDDADGSDLNCLVAADDEPILMLVVQPHVASARAVFYRLAAASART